MPCLRTRHLFALAIGATPCATTLARAQGIDVSVLALSAHHELLGNRLTGGSATMNFPRGGGQLIFRLGSERASGQADRVGTPCAGFVQPGRCSPEHVRDDARLTSVIGGAALRLFVLPRVAIAVEGDLTVASLHADTRGLTSGSTLAASKMLWGPRGGVDMSWRPMATVPVAIGIGVTTGVLAPIVHYQIADGYAPFERTFSVRTARVGLVLQSPITQ